MWIKKLQLQNFRNYSQQSVEFKSGTNILWGKNGQGKTNILEAIYYICLSKSFRSHFDKETVAFDADYFDIEANYINDNGHPRFSRIYFSQRDGKRIFVDRKPIHRFSTIIGDFPLISLLPSNRSITFGPPAERRKFLDILLSQSSKLYLADFIEFRQVLRQRNKLLSQKSIDARVLDTWDEELIKYGSKIIIKRNELLKKFSPLLNKIYNELTVDKNEISIQYKPTVNTDGDSISVVFKKIILQNRETEFRQRTTQIGPHRDKIIFELNGKSLRKYGSQGEHKTLLIALKIAEFLFVKQQKNETPIFILDDPFAELDKERTMKLLDYIQSMGQVFITMTNKEEFEKYSSINGESYYVEKGEILAA